MEKEKLKITKKEFYGVESEIANLMYKNPKNSFEHIWNVAINTASECFEGFEEFE